MPVKITPGTNPLGYFGRHEDEWRLQRVVAQDSLNHTQVVRYFEAPEGIDFAEGTAQPFKLDATANADDSANTANVTTDWHRYVANPHVLKHQFDGLWTGGPVRWGTDAQTQKRTIEQTLTRTWCAGHGYTLDEQGRYVYSTAADSLEYMTAADCLKAHRPSLASRFSPYMALREDIPGSYWREIVWRDFTHESIPFIEALKDDPATVREIVAHHFGSRVAGDVQDLTTNVDKDTNTVYVKCSLLLRDLAEPSTIDELMALPVIEAPCTRETLRIFGLNFLADGEGYKFTHTYRWPGLKDSATTRALLEWVTDSTILPKLRAADYAADEPTLLPSADGTGRFYTTQDQGGGNSCRVPWWRIQLQKLDEDKGEDGALAFTLVIVKPEWHGSELKPHVQTAVENPWFGTVERKVVPSVPRDDAERVLAGVQPGGAYRKLAAKRSSEDADGRSDITYEGRTTYDYLGGDHTPPEVGSNIFNAPDFDYDPERNVYRLGWTYVEPSKLDDLIAFATARLGGNPQIRTQYHEGGYFTLRITARGKEPVHVPEWMVAADWFRHETLEAWKGVTVETDAGGTPTGFYTEYQKNPDGTYATDAEGHLIPVGGLVPFATIRGDLDANWMGSDAQGTVTRPAAGEEVRWITTGMDAGGSGGTGDGKIAAEPDDHDDFHGNGWNAADTDWADPDGTPPGNAGDKKRLHVITRVSPSRNEDGSYDVAIHRTYPHQRYWEWKTEQESSSGDTREATHFAYRNWPSRKAIKADILDKIKARIGADWDDGWAVTGAVSVNEYGLVDAPNLTLAPSWSNEDGHIKAKGGTYYADFVIPVMERTYTPPAQFKDSLQSPADGFWWRKVTKTVQTGVTWVESRAWDAVANACEGTRGVEVVPATAHTMKHWKWHVVTNISYGAWQNTSSAAENWQGTITRHVGPPN